MNRRGATTATPIVAPSHFVLANRDAGYRNLVSALTELIDNSLQAGASRISVMIQEIASFSDGRGGAPIAVGVLDDGCGMAASTLAHALQFGGSSRFDDRLGLGRFGMGLPNSAISHARRLDVYSWQSPGAVYHSYLDVDEVVSGTLQTLPRPRRGSLPRWLGAKPAKSGTLVLWTRCDRVMRLPTRAALEDMRRSLGRVYRYPIWRGAHIQLNETSIEPIDPLYLERRSLLHGARRYGRPLLLDVAGEEGCGQIEVTFSELPVNRWHKWSVDEKRRAGIVAGGGISVVRAEREIAYGWHFFGAKRREHYDDWWRCEIRFPPVLDRMFGVTVNKQGIRPSPDLRQLLSHELEVVARTLNRRARLAFSNSPAEPGHSATVAASRHDALLMPPASLAARTTIADGLRYRLERKPLSGREFYAVRCARGSIVVTVNTNHPFFTDLYQMAEARGGCPPDYLDRLVLAAARADLEANSPLQRKHVESLRRAWSDAIAVFLRSR
ncbi:MAG: ATP-binding protein [Vicinamibacterales bacterium]